MFECVFCKIAKGDIPARVAYEDEHILCFHDLEPQAPVHVLLIPRKHIESLDAAAGEDAALLGHLLLSVRDIAARLGLENGYRLVNNCGEDGMQTVKHLHFHLLGKRRLLWPPG
ncbi:MAG: histidine triad nucleotide-binding protein [Clostridiales Family XIII bacterium]|jgi:histidine triad (HIT) family protein|nr:histidine triad nucleotide-binding protein [Clostridiales Family XIII bacterium]